MGNEQIIQLSINQQVVYWFQQGLRPKEICSRLNSRLTTHRVIKELLSSDIDLPKCKICNKKILTLTASHLKKHNITVSEYLQKYPEHIKLIKGIVKPWNKGLTKETNKLMADIAIKTKKRMSSATEKQKTSKFSKRMWREGRCKCPGTTYVEIICKRCGKKFRRIKAESDRNHKENKLQFCSKECSRSAYRPWRDEFSPFRCILNRVRHRIRLWRKQTKDSQVKNSLKILNNDLTVEFLKELWEKQQGKCDYTGWELHMPFTTQGIYDKNKHYLMKASLDRIDNTKGYTKDNIHYTSTIANFARNKFSEDDLFTFCKAVVKHRGL